MMMRIKPKILFTLGLKFVKNDLLRRISIFSDAYLPSPPNFIEIRLTLRCNLRCLQCDEWRCKLDEELPAELWKRIISDIKNYIGPYFIRFYGGEPFLRGDLLELLHFCFHNNIPTLITTNGTLINQTIAHELARNKVVLINISLDGFKAETHDKLRGVAGTYDRIMQSINHLQGKVPVQINTTIMENNLDEILDLSEFAYKNKLQISFQGYYDKKYFTNDINLTQADSLFPQDLKKLDYIIDKLCQMKKYNTSIIDSNAQLERFKLFYRRLPQLKKQCCEAIGSRLMVKQQGNITLCSYSGPIGIIGNLAENSLRDIWESKEAIQKIKKMKKCEVTECIAMRGCYRESYLEKIAKIKRNVFK